ncbi:MAG: ParA family protein [Micrococcaceae bacterium]|nr:ParA family protein [Micrococcaceae bacterium]
MQVISISSLKGGVGKTSITLGLASAAWAAGISTLVIDLDPHADTTTGLGIKHDESGRDIGTMLRKPKQHHISEHVVAAGWSDANQPDGQRPGTLHVAKGSAKTSMFEKISTRRRDLNRLATLLDHVDQYDLVLVDCPPALNGITRMAWAASTDVLLVAEPSLFSVAGTERTFRALDLFQREYAPNLKNSAVVVNRVRAASTEHKYRVSEMRRMFGNRLLSIQVPETSNWQQIQGAAWPVHAWPGETATTAGKIFDQLLEGLYDVKQPPRRARRT